MNRTKSLTITLAIVTALSVFGIASFYEGIGRTDRTPPGQPVLARWEDVRAHSTPVPPRAVDELWESATHEIEIPQWWSEYLAECLREDGRPMWVLNRPSNDLGERLIDYISSDGRVFASQLHRHDWTVQWDGERVMYDISTCIIVRPEVRRAATSHEH